MIEKTNNNAWHPIETAPKDGTWVELWRKPETEIGISCPLIWGRWSKIYDTWIWPDCGVYDPFTERGRESAEEEMSESDVDGGWFYEDSEFTHWRPLTEPPKEGEK